MALSPLKIPPQAAPYTEATEGSEEPNRRSSGFGGARTGRIFNIVWWKFFQSVVDWIDYLYSLVVAASTDVTIIGEEVPGATQETSDTKGDHLSIRMFGAIGNTRSIHVSATAASATITSADANFTAEDIGKRIVIYGAGSAGAPAQIAETVAVSTSTDSFLPLGSIDTQAASVVKLGANCGFNDVTWEVFGSNNAGFAPEFSVHGPENIITGAPSIGYSEAPPTYRYYRTKVKSTVPGDHGAIFISGTALGLVLGATIVTVTNLTTATISTAAGATRSNCDTRLGHDDTANIQAAIDYAFSRIPAGTGDGGINLYAPVGNYLFSSPIDQKPGISITGESGSSTIFIADAAAMPQSVPQWNMTGNYSSDQRIAFFTRVQDIRLDCGHVPGSIGFFCDALQENSGLIRATVIQWLSKGVVSGEGCANWKIDDAWIYPSTSAFLDPDVVGLDVSIGIDVFLTRTTIQSQGGFLGGYGTGILAGNGLSAQGQIRAYMVHFEGADVGIKFVAGGGGIMDGATCLFNVTTAVELNGESPISVRNVVTLGVNALIDNNSGATYTDSWLSEYTATNSPRRIRGGSSNLRDMWQIIPGGLYAGDAAWVFDYYGNLIMGQRASPNVVSLNSIPFGSDTQGGLLTVNSRYIGFPNWEKTTTDPSDNALFFVLSGQGIDIRQGPAQQPTYVATGICNVSGTAVARVSGTVFSLVWPAGSQIILDGGVIAIIAAVIDANNLTLTVSAGSLSGVTFGVSTDPSAFGGASPGESLMSVYKGVGAKISRVYFDGNFFMQWGNNLDTSRSRWAQTGASQEYLRMQRSADSGGSWDDHVSYKLDDGSTIFNGPVSVQGNVGQSIYSGSGDPEGVVSASPGSLYMRSTGDVYIKATGTGNTGWQLLNGILRGSGSPEGVVAAGVGTLYLNSTGGDGEVLWVKESGTGNTGWKSDGGTIWQPVGGTGNTVFEATKEIEIGTLVVTAVQNMDYLVGGQPLKLDLSKNIVAGQIDLSSSDEIAGTGLTAGDILQWDGSAVVGVVPTITTLTYVTGLSGTVPPGLIVDTDTIDVVTGIP